MNPHLETAIIQFLANEYHLDPKNLLADTNFFEDFNLSETQFIDLITRMQDALNFILPEEKISTIHTLSDLLSSLSHDEVDPNEPL